jgi:hypothetical protein
MSESRFQKRNRETCELLVSIFPKNGKAIKHKTAALNKRIDKKKRAQFKALGLKRKEPRT